MIHIRTPHAPSAQLAPDLPPSVVWLNRGTVLCISALVVIVLALGLRALLNAPWFAIGRIQMLGDTQYHNALTIRANVLPQLSGNYFTLDLRRAQAQFEALPWIRSAVVQRIFPNQLQASLVAHQPVAVWQEVASQTTEGSGLSSEQGAELETLDIGGEIERLVNTQGEVFEASGGHIDTNSLPRLSGPAHSSTEVFALFQDLRGAMQQQSFQIVQLDKSAYGFWRAVLNNQSQMELGTGTRGEIVARVHRWLTAMPQVVQRYGAREALSIDLRYTSGFAMRLAGITTNTR